MPSSGARSGTKPSRSSRGARDGRIVTIVLECGCKTDDPPTIDAPVRRWWCCGQWRKARRQ